MSETPPPYGERELLSDERLAEIHRRATVAGLSDVAAVVAELQLLRAQHGSAAALERSLVGALRSAIHDHGPISADMIGSAVKRILGNLRNAGR